MILKFRYARDSVFRIMIALMTILVVLPLFIIILYVLINGGSAIRPDFFLRDLGSPIRAMTGQPSGLIHSILGTIIIDLCALFIAVPFGLSAGILMSEYPDNPLAPPAKLLTSTLNGMPAVLMGLLAYALIVKNSGGFSAIAGSMALAFVMIPIIARAAESSLRITPWSLRENGLALGLPRWIVITQIVIPAARPGLITGILIAFARGAGEAAPLLLTSFGNNYLSFNMSKPMDTLPQRLYSLAISPYKQWHVMGWGGAILLLFFVIIVFYVGRKMTAGMEARAEQKIH